MEFGLPRTCVKPFGYEKYTIPNKFHYICSFDCKILLCNNLETDNIVM